MINSFQKSATTLDISRDMKETKVMEGKQIDFVFEMSQNDFILALKSKTYT